MAGVGIELSRVLGCAVERPTMLAQHPSNPTLLAYSVGCCVVLHDVQADVQRFTTAPSGARIGERARRMSCVVFSSCGTFVAAADVGADASIFVWRVDTLKCTCERQSLVFE